MIWLPAAWELYVYRFLAPEGGSGKLWLAFLANGFTWIWLPVLLGIPMIRGRSLAWISRAIWVQAFFTIPYQLVGLAGILLRRPSPGMLAAEYGLLSPVYYLSETTSAPDPFTAACVSMVVCCWKGQSPVFRMVTAVLILFIILLRISAGIGWPMDEALALPAGMAAGMLLRAGYHATERILASESFG